jgi:hypothetical protein
MYIFGGWGKSENVFKLIAVVLGETMGAGVPFGLHAVHMGTRDFQLRGPSDGSRFAHVCQVTEQAIHFRGVPGQADLQRVVGF